MQVDGDHVSVEDDYDISRWQPGSPHAVRTHGERLAMSPSDFSGMDDILGGLDDSALVRRRY